MDHWIVALYAAGIGAAGSLAYASALYFGFVFAEDIMKRLWPSSNNSERTGESILRLLWFILIGGAVAFIFQLPESVLAPIQAFIIGTTWPTVVSQVLTGRQSGTSIPNQIDELIVRR